MNCRAVSLNNLARFVVGGIFSLCLASSTLAQRTPPGPPPGAGPPPKIDPKGDDHVRQVTESRLRSTELDVATEAESQKRVQAAIVNVKQDFTRIQVLRNDIARDLVARKPLDFNLVTEQTAEINKRAHRLKTYMMSRVPDDIEQTNPPDIKSEEMIGALVKLCKLIDSFTDNPTLKNAATVDAKGLEKVKEDKARADKDLLAIIKLSANIQKTSGALKAAK